MTDIALVYAVFPDETSARAVAQTVVRERLAACVNILPSCISIYEWDGKEEENMERPAMFKTSAKKAAALIARVAELHSYAVPAILCWQADTAHAPFAEWVEEHVTT
jgi:periplasmic divalent cation tolerance protein